VIYNELDFKVDHVSRMSQELISKLETMYFNMDCEKLVITSGWRSEEHNDEIGGHPDSPHLYGMAVDIACSDSSTRSRILEAAIPLGFWGIGIYDRHVHLDVKPRLDGQRKVWLGISK